MTLWKDRLIDADRALAREMSPEDTERLRRIVVGEAASAARSGLRWSLPFTLAAGSLTAASIALVLSTVIAAPVPAVPADDELATSGDAALEAPSPGSGRQQLQFATPGGTRIIWVFDAEFEVKGTLP